MLKVVSGLYTNGTLHPKDRLAQVRNDDILSSMIERSKMLGCTVAKIDVLRWILLFGLVVPVGTAALLLAGDGRSAVAKDPAQQTVPDPQSVLDGRSPGDRDPGALFQTKPLQNLLDAAGLPTAPQTNLMAPSPLPPVEEVPGAYSAIVPPEQALAGPVGAPAVVPVGPVVDTVPGGVSPFLPVPLPPLGAPVLFQPVPNGPPPETSPPGGGVSAVPEPATWMTMLTGFFAIGGLVRRGRLTARLQGR